MKLFHGFLLLSSPPVTHSTSFVQHVLYYSSPVWSLLSENLCMFNKSLPRPRYALFNTMSPVNTIYHWNSWLISTMALLFISSCRPCALNTHTSPTLLFLWSATLQKRICLWVWTVWVPLTHTVSGTHTVSQFLTCLSLVVNKYTVCSLSSLLTLPIKTLLGFWMQHYAQWWRKNAQRLLCFGSAWILFPSFFVQLTIVEVS